MRFFEELGVDLELSDMSFSVSLDNGKGYEWAISNGLAGLFAQKTNVLNPFFWQMLCEILKFKQHVVEYAHQILIYFQQIYFNVSIQGCFPDTAV
jgi:cyclopropane-fatty-acyl-phospholipid synthase